ncbi:MAG: heavy-metal-associated domain-containing protein [Bacteroidota bacterium]|nr:heavy-metal-associated domain-containing protein [Bacteroidota bacterium]
MVCEGCAEKITNALTAIPGVKDVKSKARKKQVFVYYDHEQTNYEILKSVLEKEGFNAVDL